MDDIHQIEKAVLKTFFDATKREKINLKIEYVDDLYSRALDLSRNNRQKNEIVNSEEFIRGLNGTMVFPEKKGDIAYILISKAILNEYYFIGTIVHELTHIYDFMDFASEFCDDNYDYEIIESHNLFNSFYFWTEFNARRYGYLFYREIGFSLFGGESSIEEQIEDILNRELKFHQNRLFIDFNEYKHDKNNHKFMYSMIQFMGRFSIWEDLFSESITSREYLPDYLQQAFGNKVYKLYDLLRYMREFCIVRIKLSELKRTIDQFFM